MLLKGRLIIYSIDTFQGQALVAETGNVPFEIGKS
jgi:hypothetical protein